MVKYISGNSGKEILFNTYEIGIGSGNPYSTKWSYSGTRRQYGIEIDQFEKDPLLLPIEFRFRGSKEDIKDNKNIFFEECEKDIMRKKPGTFIVGDWSAEGYFVERATSPSEEFYGDLMSTVLLVPYPFWIKTIKKQFLPQKESTEEEGLDFETDFEFDFANEELGNETWEVEHYDASHFKMIIYGPCNEPIIHINDYPYQIHTELKENEYLIIDSRKNEVTKYLSDGSTEDLYNSRAFKNSVFEKIPSGKLKINWSGEFGFDIILFLERSEPKW